VLYSDKSPKGDEEKKIMEELRSSSAFEGRTTKTLNSSGDVSWTNLETMPGLSDDFPDCVPGYDRYNKICFRS